MLDASPVRDEDRDGDFEGEFDTVAVIEILDVFVLDTEVVVVLDCVVEAVAVLVPL